MQSELDVKLARSNYFPSLDLQAGYAYSNSQFDANFLESQRKNFSENPDSAKALVGDLKSANSNEAEFAAWIMIASTILNLDETISKP